MNYVWLNIIFGLVYKIKCLEKDDIFNLRPKTQCPDLDTSNIGLIYLYHPFRQIENFPFEPPPKNGIVFKTHHLYSLLTFIKLFKPTPKNRLLFYYVNDSGKPVNNHYNQWLNDTEWNSRLPINSIKFIKIDHDPVNSFRLNLVEIANNVKKDSINRFDVYKEKYILLTSDIIIGPKIFSCFTKDVQEKEVDASDIYNLDYIKYKTQIDCYESLKSDTKNLYSFLYKLDFIHSPNDFSGILIWTSKYEGNIDKNLVNIDNVYKCSYRNDILKSNKLPYDESFCIFGFELNAYEPPILQELFFNENTYFRKFMRKSLYGDPDPVVYKISPTPVIPNIVHLIWFSSTPYKTLKFIEYLCLKSILYVLKPDKIRIHGDEKPYKCEYWKELSKNPKIEWVYREKPLFKYNQNFSSSPIQHLADVARLEVLYEEGGIYSDFDILWVKPLDKFRYLNVDLIAANDLTSYCSEFPFNIQIGTFLAPKNSEFVKKWLNGYKEKYHLYPGDYVAVSMCEPYKIYEKNPKKVFIDNRLQMIYFNGWSAFIPKYTEIEQEKLKEFNENLDWLNDGTHGYHMPRHGDLHSRLDYDKADKKALPIQIASYILNL